MTKSYLEESELHIELLLISSRWRIIKQLITDGSFYQRQRESSIKLLWGIFKFLFFTCPRMRGKNSVYVMCWIWAIKIFLVSWNTISSGQWGFNWASCLATRLCSLNHSVWSVANPSCSFTLLSPALKHLKPQCLITEIVIPLTINVFDINLNSLKNIWVYYGKNQNVS